MILPCSKGGSSAWKTMKALIYLRPVIILVTLRLYSVLNDTLQTGNYFNTLNHYSSSHHFSEGYRQLFYRTKTLSMKNPKSYPFGPKFLPMSIKLFPNHHWYGDCKITKEPGPCKLRKEITCRKENKQRSND